MSSVTTLSPYRPSETAARRLAVQRGKPDASQEKLALVLPSLREAENLRELLDRVRAALASVEIPCEILVVDDDSRDGTREIVAAIAREDARVRLLERREARGLSGAILHGWQRTDASILGVMDADGQHPAERVPALLAAIQDGRDLAIASRYARGGSGWGWNPIRWLISAAAIWVARPLEPRCLEVSDPLSGFFLVRRRCVENVLFQTTGFKLLLEILVRGRIESVEEVPIAFGKRRAGRSKASPKVAWDYLLLLIRLYAAKCRMIRVAREEA
jgi:dolichol-phosphate mannosyltransferase